MTAYATRSPLQILTNPHMMSERRTSRRTSARLADKEDASVANGIGHGTDRAKGNQSNGASGRQGKAGTNVEGLRGKRKLDYDEESDGFKFRLTRSKKVKPEPTIQPIEENDEQGVRPAPPRKSRKQASSPSSAVSVENSTKVEKRRRSSRNSGDQSTTDPPALHVKKRKTKENRISESGPSEKEEPPTNTPGQRETLNGVESRSASTRVESHAEGTKISLPFADTPVIRRNQEMRRGAENGHRRSSLGMRGRRASSLIDSGKSNALPHDEVESSQFYKHIESNGLSEPRRMRQLLTWCGTRAMGDKPSFSSEDSHARLAAREIQQQLLKDFSSKSELSDWFNRKDSTPPPQPPKPNPKNLSNHAKIQDLEQQIARLQIERQTWESLLRPPPTDKTLIPPLSPKIPPLTSIDPTLLSSPTQLAAFTTLQSFIPSAMPPSTATTPPPPSTSLHDITSTRLEQMNKTLEFEIDKFAGNVHALGAYKEAAEQVADEVLGMSAEALEEREREGRKRLAEEEGGGEVGMRDVLRGLSRIIDR